MQTVLFWILPVFSGWSLILERKLKFLEPKGLSKFMNTTSYFLENDSSDLYLLHMYSMNIKHYRPDLNMLITFSIYNAILH